MQHLPLPRQPLLGELPIPLLSSRHYDGGPFLSYPERRGWNISLRKWPYTVVQPSGANPSPPELAAFVQTWLYFGLLSQYLDEVANTQLFETQNDGVGMLLSTMSLEQLVCDRTAKLHIQHSSSDSAKAKIWMTSMYGYLIKAREYVLRFQNEEKTPDGIISLVCLSIAVLGEYLMQALKDLHISLDLATPVQQNWRVLGGNYDSDCGAYILSLMPRQGWCPMSLARFNREEVMSVGRLWYFANLSPPRANLSHATCTAELCQHLQVDKTQYQLAHSCERHDCAAIGPEHALLKSIIMNGELPLIKVQTDNSSSSVSVEIEPHVTGTYFVAISHVWADGRGNPAGNLLPACTLLQIQSLINRFLRDGPCTNLPFWIDTLCVPRFPKSLRNEALKRLRDPYDLAGNVLVIDAYLQNQSIVGASLAEILARVTCCGWTQRLWTFQEGRLAKRTWFAFQDRCVDLWAEVDTWREYFTRLPPLACHATDLLMIGYHTATSIYPGQSFTSGLDSLPALRLALRTRATSVQSDEALCLSSILGLDTQIIVETDSASRMQRLWSMMPRLPAGLALSKSRQKLPVKGYRWAPASIMGEVSQKFWDGPNGLPIAFDADHTDSGLVVALPAFLFVASDQQEYSMSKRTLMLDVHQKDMTFPFCESNSGQWFACKCQEAWHQESAPIDTTEEPAILMDRTLKYGDEVFPRVSDDFQSQGTEQGVFVSYERQRLTQEVVPAKAYRHVQLQMMSRKNHELMDIINVITDSLCREHEQDILAMRDDAAGMQRMLKRLVGEKLREGAALEIAMSIREAAGDSTDEDAAVEDCLRIFRLLCRFASGTEVQATTGQIKWCID